MSKTKCLLPAKPQGLRPRARGKGIDFLLTQPEIFIATLSQIIVKCDFCYWVENLGETTKDLVLGQKNFELPITVN